MQIDKIFIIIIYSEGIKLKSWDYNLNLEFDKYQGIKNWLKYRICDMDYDCDVSKYAMDVYKEKYEFLSTGIVQHQYNNFPSFQKWNRHNLKWEIQLNDTLYSGDTLNSFATPFNRFANVFISKLNNKKFKLTYIGKDTYELLLKEFDIVFSDYNLSQVEYSREIIEYFDKFANLTHTIGNLFPVPLYFNKERTGENGDYEFPDILLKSIYDFYLSKDSNKKEVGISVIKEKKRIDKTVKWLDSFGSGKAGWNKFIEVYRFSMYLDEKSEPMELWNNHNIENTKTPDIGEEFLYYLSFVCDCIEKRGNEIFIRNSKNNAKIYKKH